MKVVDDIVAVDTFCGYFLWAYGSGKPLEEALRLAGAAAALAVSHFGALPVIPALAEVRAFLQKEAVTPEDSAIASCS